MCSDNCRSSRFWNDCKKILNVFHLGKTGGYFFFLTQNSSQGVRICCFTCILQLFRIQSLLVLRASVFPSTRRTVLCFLSVEYHDSDLSLSHTREEDDRGTFRGTNARISSLFGVRQFLLDLLLLEIWCDSFSIILGARNNSCIREKSGI